MFRPTPHHSACAVVLALCMALGTVPALGQAQASTGQIAGSVVDSSGAAISGATVKASNAATGIQRSVRTGDDGLYRFVLLPPGIYTVSAEADGFATSTISNVDVVVGRTADINITLGVSGVQEVVSVTAGAIQVQTTRSEADAVLDERAIDNLPINGRRFQDFVTLTPSAQVDPQRGQISLVGQRGINANVSIDGADYNQPFFGGIRGGERSNTAFTIPQESIKEFQVVSSGYSAEFGRSSGGIVNAVTKSGTNQWHGSGFILYRPKEAARNHAWFDALEQQLDREIDPAPTQHQFGGSFGGPIVKDRAFVFAAYEQQRFRNPREVLFDALTTLTPTPATQEAFDFFRSLQTPFVQTNDAKAFLGRFDYEINPMHRFNVRYSYSKNEALNANATGNALFPTTISALSNNGTEGNNTHTVVGQFTSFFSPTTVNELRGQYSREERPRDANALEPTVETSIGRFGTVSFLPTTQYDWRVQIADSLTWNKAGHTFKFGGEYNHVFIDQTFGFNQFGRFSFFSTPETILEVLSVGGPTPNRFANTGASYLLQLGNLEASYSTDELAFFVQDSWRIRTNFTLNYGVRWEGQFNPSPEANNTDLINRVTSITFPSGHRLDPTQIPDSKKQWGPRVGFAWDPFSDTKTVIRAFAGIYHARTPLLLLAGPFNNFRTPPGDLSIRLPLSTASLPVGDPRRTCNTLHCQLTLIGINLNNFSLGNLPRLTPEQALSVAQALGLSFDPFAGVQPILMDADHTNPRSYQWGVGVEREVTRGLTVGVDFTYVNTVRLQRNRDVNLPLPIIRPDDPAQRPFFQLRSTPAGPAVPRPIPTLGSIQIREATARSLYRAMTLRTKFQRNWGQFNAFYTLGRSLSDDDNERDAGGVAYENAFNVAPEYNHSRLDVRHQFLFNPVFFLPWGIDLSSAMRLRSGRPVDARLGIDENADLVNLERPYSAPGVPFKRNAFRNRAEYLVDVRAQKRITIAENYRVIFSVEMFNVFNAANIEISTSSAVVNYCANPAVQRDCGFGAPSNPNFLQIRDRRPGSPRFGLLLLDNNPGPPFQMQFGARFQF